tara:strand:+ start:901 stop:1047 length:147 start_codon:yes stop_codon:yes gene_type:complete
MRRRHVSISPRTVNKHLEQIFPELMLEKRTAVYGAYIDNGGIEEKHDV